MEVSDHLHTECILFPWYCWWFLSMFSCPEEFIRDEKGSPTTQKIVLWCLWFVLYYLNLHLLLLLLGKLQLKVYGRLWRGGIRLCLDLTYLVWRESWIASGRTRILLQFTWQRSNIAETKMKSFSTSFLMDCLRSTFFQFYCTNQGWSYRLRIDSCSSHLWRKIT